MSEARHHHEAPPTEIRHTLLKPAIMTVGINQGEDRAQSILLLPLIKRRVIGYDGQVRAIVVDKNGVKNNIMKPSIAIGRNPDNDIIMDGSTVSRKHAHTSGLHLIDTATNHSNITDVAPLPGIQDLTPGQWYMTDLKKGSKQIIKIGGYQLFLYKKQHADTPFLVVDMYNPNNTSLFNSPTGEVRPNSPSLPFHEDEVVIVGSGKRDSANGCNFPGTVDIPDHDVLPNQLAMVLHDGKLFIQQLAPAKIPIYAR